MPWLLHTFLLAGVVLAAQGARPAEPPAIPMPLDRAVDSYRIYSSLLPLGETAEKDWPREQWLLEDTTITAVQPGDSCSSADANQGMGMNPHVAIHPPEDRRQDFAELMEDFDRHCHERLTLDPAAWHLAAPVHLLNRQEQGEFQSSRFSPSKDRQTAAAIAAKYKGASSLFSFSQVYFNAHHSVALVYATHWCGMLCGEGYWIAFELRDGRWVRLNWRATQWIS